MAEAVGIRGALLALGETLYQIPASTLIVLGLVALVAFGLTFGLPRRMRLPVRSAAVLVALVALGVHAGATAYARLVKRQSTGPPIVTCYVQAPLRPGGGRGASPQERMEALGSLLARGVESAEVGRRAGALFAEHIRR